MSYPYHPTNEIPTTTTSSLCSSLLSPPQSPRNDHDVPFKAAESDTTSLSMKKAMGKRTRKSKRKNKTAVLTWITTDSPIPSKSNDAFLSSRRSLPSLTEQASAKSTVAAKKMKKDSGVFNWETITSTRRRWTLPTKSVPTCGVTTLKPVVKQAGLQQDVESPAMITLRRATSSAMRTNRKMSITFFPEPTFDKPQSQLFAYLTSTFIGKRNTIASCSMFVPDHAGTARTLSGSHDGFRSITSAAAAPVSTAVTLEPTTTAPGEVADVSRSRRCSTRYTADTTVYEVLWDENDSSSARTESTQLSVDRTLNDRRSSMAMATLEAQRRKSEAQSRQSSAGMNRNDTNSYETAAAGQLIRRSLQDVLQSRISRVINEAALRNLPRSRLSKRVFPTASPVVVCQAAVHETISAEEKQRCLCQWDFFPPPEDRSTTTVDKLSTSRRASRQSTRGHPQSRHNRVAGRIGSLVGSYSGVRRRSTMSRGLVNTKDGEPRFQDGRHFGTDRMDPRNTDQDRLPMMDPLRWEESSPW